MDNKEFGGLGDGIFVSKESKQEVQVKKSELPVCDPIAIPDLKKRARKPMSRRQKAIRTMLRRSGKEKIPPLSQIVKNEGVPVKISEVGIFSGDPDDDLLAVLAAECPVRSKVYPSAEIMKSRVIVVGSQILEAGRMYHPIHLAKTPEGIECTSGRHRLAFLAMVYGPDAQIPCHVEEMTLKEAREAAVVSNQCRPEKAMERAENAVLMAVGGDADVEQDKLYERTITTKNMARKYAVFSVMERHYPIKLGFKVSPTSSRRDGGITTLSNVESFWGYALPWTAGMERKAFDAELKSSVRFLNSLVEMLQTDENFDPDKHFSTDVLIDLGRLYRWFGDTHKKNALVVVELVSELLVNGIVTFDELVKEIDGDRRA